jgi:hypothetical protein
VLRSVGSLSEDHSAVMFFHLEIFVHAQGSKVPPHMVQIRNHHFCPLSSRKAAGDKGLDKRPTDQSKLDRQSDIGEK